MSGWRYLALALTLLVGCGGAGDRTASEGEAASVCVVNCPIGPGQAISVTGEYVDGVTATSAVVHFTITPANVGATVVVDSRSVASTVGATTRAVTVSGLEPGAAHSVGVYANGLRWSGAFETPLPAPGPTTPQGMYPRLARSQDGFTTYLLLNEPPNDVRLLRSTDGGATWATVSGPPVPGLYPGTSGPLAVTNECCGTVFDWSAPDGTERLIVAAVVTGWSTFHPNTTEVWISDPLQPGPSPAPPTWSTPKSVLVATAAPYAAWEPEFVVDEYGDLEAFYSYEIPAAPGSSDLAQQIVMKTWSNGTWSAPVVVVDTVAGDRPGMANVRRMPDGAYAMSYEICGRPVGPTDCAVHVRGSWDGRYWGDALARSNVATDPSGAWFAHAPTLASTPDGLLLVGEEVWTPSPTAGAVRDEAATGRTMFRLLGSDVSMTWGRTAAPVSIVVPPAPVGVPFPPANLCTNYSSSLLLSPDAAQVLEAATAWVTPAGAPPYCAPVLGVAGL